MLIGRAMRVDSVSPTAGPLAAAGRGQTKQQVIDSFHELIFRTVDWDRVTWLGVPAQQTPNDVWAYQQIVYETKPDFIIEAGTNKGGGALVWATLLSVINPSGKVLTIDIEDRLGDVRQRPLFRERVEFTLGSSTAEATFAAIKTRVSGKKAMVILDSNHEKAHVLQEMMLYGDLVPVGGYLLVQDSNVNGHPVLPDHGPGPAEAIDAFFAQGGKSSGGAVFEVDTSRTPFLFTTQPGGYLRRVQ
jgi:cephalosporin hydroxylase